MKRCWYDDPKVEHSVLCIIGLEVVIVIFYARCAIVQTGYAMYWIIITNYKSLPWPTQAN